MDLSSNNPYSWTWLFPGASPSFSTDQNPENIVYDYQGVYDVTLIAENSAGIDTLVKVNYINVISTIGILDDMSSNFKVFPNPTTGKVMLSIGQIEIPYSIHIKDLSGREIYFSKTNNLKEEIDLTNFPKGLYIIEIKNNVLKKELKIIRH